MKATKNDGTFEALNTREGMRYIATRGNVEVWLSPYEYGYTASLYTYNRPQMHADGVSATWALQQLAKECKATAWVSECDDFFAEVIFPLCKDLNDFMNRPARETYNSR